MLPAVVAAVALAIAGHPVAVKCDAETTYHGPEAVLGWATPGASTIHLYSGLCEVLEEGIDAPSFPVAFATLIHESAHARGVTVEACAELWADLTYADWLDRFYGIPLLSPRSFAIGAAIYQNTLEAPTAYQPTATSCEGQP